MVRYGPLRRALARLAAIAITVCTELLTVAQRGRCPPRVPRLENHERSVIRVARRAGLDFGLVVQDHVQQRIVNFQRSVVINEAQLAEFVHEGS